MITNTETGLTSGEYDAIKDGNLPSTHKIIAHKLSPDFALLSALSGTPPFYAVLTDMYLIVKDSGSTLHRYNLITEVWDTGTSPFTGQVRLFSASPGTTLWAFYIE